jgi:hypothetical protein
MYTIRIKVNETRRPPVFLKWRFQQHPFSVNSAFEHILFQQSPYVNRIVATMGMGL